MCIIIGDPVEHSLSPRMHNLAYEALGIDDQFIYTAARVNVNDIAKVADAVRVMNIRGLTCTIPHKIEILKYIDKIDSVASKIGAVNTVVNDDGILIGYNTDWLGVVTPLANIMNTDPSSQFLGGKVVALLGAGGAARAAAYAFIERGAQLRIYNRTLSKAQELANEVGAKAYELASITSLDDVDIIFNSTSLGMGEEVDSTPVDEKFISDRHIVFDSVYVPYETRLLREAKAKGAKVIHGIQMLLHQGTAQFELYTLHAPPVDVMESALLEHFGIAKIESDRH